MADKKKGKKGRRAKKSETVEIIREAEVRVPVEPCRGADALLLQAIADDDTFMLAQIMTETPDIDINRRNQDDWIPLHVCNEIMTTMMMLRDLDSLLCTEASCT
jgi:hypothetical protein